MESLPVWPPLLALAVAAFGVLYFRRESKRFDERHGNRSATSDRAGRVDR